MAPPSAGSRPALPERPRRRQPDHADVGVALQHDSAKDPRKDTDAPEEDDLEDGRGRNRWGDEGGESGGRRRQTMHQAIKDFRQAVDLTPEAPDFSVRCVPLSDRAIVCRV